LHFAQAVAKISGEGNKKASLLVHRPIWQVIKNLVSLRRQWGSLCTKLDFTV